jgi:hypothetical protein
MTTSVQVAGVCFPISSFLVVISIADIFYIPYSRVVRRELSQYLDGLRVGLPRVQNFADHTGRAV